MRVNLAVACAILIVRPARVWRDAQFSSGDVVLAGWLAVPVRDEVRPGVVLVGGSVLLIVTTARTSRLSASTWWTRGSPCCPMTSAALARHLATGWTRPWTTLPPTPRPRWASSARSPRSGPTRRGCSGTARGAGSPCAPPPAGQRALGDYQRLPGDDPSRAGAPLAGLVLRRAGEQDAGSMLALFDRLVEAGRRDGDFAEVRLNHQFRRPVAGIP